MEKHCQSTTCSISQHSTVILGSCAAAASFCWCVDTLNGGSSQEPLMYNSSLWISLWSDRKTGQCYHTRLGLNPDSDCWECCGYLTLPPFTRGAKVKHSKEVLSERTKNTVAVQVLSDPHDPRVRHWLNLLYPCLYCC
jgi:hypothetical protein